MVGMKFSEFDREIYTNGYTYLRRSCKTFLFYNLIRSHSIVRLFRKYSPVVQ